METFEEFHGSLKDGRRSVLSQFVIGRSGSLFLQSLLDGHPQILMFPGIVNYYADLWPKVEKDPKNWKATFLSHFQFIDDLVEPYNIHKGLGVNGNDSISIDYAGLAEGMDRLSPDITSGRTMFFAAFHYALAQILGVNLSLVKCVYAHEHTINMDKNWMGEVFRDFPAGYIICITRDPLSNLTSILNWNSKRKEVNNLAWRGNAYQKDILLQFTVYWYINGLKVANELLPNFLLIRLEDIRTHKREILLEMLRHVHVGDSDVLDKTTFLGKLWNGDKFNPSSTGYRAAAPLSGGVHLGLIKVLLWKERFLLKYGERQWRYRMMAQMGLIVFLFFSIFDIRERKITGQFELVRKQYNLSYFQWLRYEMKEILKSYRVFSSYLRSSRSFSEKMPLNIIQMTN